MKIKILRNTIADGKQVFVGEVVNVETATANLLISFGKAEEYPGEGVDQDPGEGVDQDPGEGVDQDPGEE